jgi:hypothetical protein
VRPARFAVPSLALGLLLALATTAIAFGVVACGGSNASTESDEPESETESDESVEPDEDNEMAARGKDLSAWRWEGDRKACFYLHDGRCFKKLETACRAAGCGESRCKHDKSAPSVVSCSK